jgi:FkbM family methyltransferase
VNRPERVLFYYIHEPYGPYWDRVRDRLELVRVDPVPLVAGFSYADRSIPPYRYAHHSDFIRLEKLLDSGGVYADMDTLFVAPLPAELFEAPFVVGRERDIAHPRDGRRVPSLCNAFLMSEPDALFGRRWLEEMPAWFDGTWSNHSTLLPEHLSRRYPEAVRVSAEGLSAMFERSVAMPAGTYSIHLWAHLWWSAERVDFSAFHSGMLTEEFVRGANSTYALAARRFLPPAATRSLRTTWNPRTKGVRGTKAQAAARVRAAARATRSARPATEDPRRRARRSLLRQAMRQLRHREGFDDCIVMSVIGDDEYEVLDRRFAPDDVIIDVGAHIGAFTYACHRNGSRRLHAFEPEPVNFERLRRNLRGLEGTHLSPSAMFRSDGVPANPTLLHSGRDTTDTGNGNVLFGGKTFWVDTQEVWANESSLPVAAVPLDDVLSRFETVTLLKLACKGSEFPILLTSRELRRVKEIVGRFQEIGTEMMHHLAPEARVGEFTHYHPLLLVAKLEADGFRVTLTPRRRLGMFRAVRR